MKMVLKSDGINFPIRREKLEPKCYFKSHDYSTVTNGQVVREGISVT